MEKTGLTSYYSRNWFSATQYFGLHERF